MKLSIFGRLALELHDRVGEDGALLGPNCGAAQGRKPQAKRRGADDHANEVLLHASIPGSEVGAEAPVVGLHVGVGVLGEQDRVVRFRAQQDPPAQRDEESAAGAGVIKIRRGAHELVVGIFVHHTAADVNEGRDGPIGHQHHGASHSEDEAAGVSL